MQSANAIAKIYSYGAATQAEVANYIKSRCVEQEVQNLETIMGTWRKASGRFQEITKSETGIAETIDVKDVNTSQNSKLAAIAANPLFQQTFAMFPIEFKLIEIAKLIASQRLVDLDYVNKLKTTLPQDPQLSDLIDFCIAPKKSPQQPKILQLAPNVFTYSDLNPDFRFLGGYKKPLTEDDIKAAGGGQPTAALVLLVGYGSSTCNVYSVGKRIILNNGFHRMYALLDKGIKYAPVVVQKVSNPELEFPPHVSGLPKDYLLKNPRPVLMKDFFDKELVTMIHENPTMKAVQIGWNAQESQVPI